jgi:general secretion pathway protein G
MKKNNNQNGFSLIELIIVISILGILSAISIPRIIGFTEQARAASDKSTIRTLNIATALYAAIDNITTNDVFDGINTDSERLNILVNEGFFNEAPEPQKKDAEFLWNIENQKWLYSMYAVADSSLTNYIFKNTNKSDYTFNAWGGGGGTTWSINEDGLYTTGANGSDLLFIGNNNSNYSLTTTFKLENNASNNGGIGLFFETIIDSDNNNRDTGYILQFDRGYSEIVIRKRTNGTESGSDILARIGNKSTSTIKVSSIPDKSDNWWESEKEITLNVSDGSIEGKKLVTVMLNGENILTNFEIESDIEPENNHTGFRAWNGSPVSIYDLTIN